jgi:hypothetical protein
VRGRTLGWALVITVMVVGLVVVLERPWASQGSSDGPSPTTSSLLSSSTSSPSGSSVTLPMGHLDDPTNTFWELFVRSPGSSTWQLRTPPGVASNGGLVVGLSGDGALTAGFVPSVNLTFSPLAQSATGGLTWTPGHLPTGLAAVPSGIASAAGSSLALGARDGGTVLKSVDNLSRWSSVATGRSLASSLTACSLTSISAVALSEEGQPLVGLSCAAGSSLGIASTAGAGSSGRSWHLVGPTLGSGAPAATSVVRLQGDASGLTGLGTTSRAGVRSLLAFWGDGTATGWVESGPFPLPKGWTIASTGIASSTDDENEAILLRSGDRREIVTTDRATKAWTVLPSPPHDAEAVASFAQETDAFTVDGARLTVWTLSEGSTTWVKGASSIVPLQYGSSS